MSARVYEVATTIDGTHPKHTTYPLLPGDVLVERADGTFYKTAPGLGITGFVLTAEQRESLIPRTKVGPLEFVEGGLAGYADYLASKTSNQDRGQSE